MCDYSGLFVSTRGQFFINYVISYAYHASDIIDDKNYATELESFVSTLSLQVAQINTKKVSRLDHLVLAKK